SFFRHSNWDVIPALCGVGIVALIFWTFLGFDSLSWWVLVPAFIAVMFSYCWNLQCISHNFIHNPYFSSRWLNSAFGVLETFALRAPHALSPHSPLTPHWGDNARKGPDGSTRDWSSIYRHSPDERPENFWKYIFVSFFRVETVAVIRTAHRCR